MLDNALINTLIDAGIAFLSVYLLYSLLKDVLEQLNRSSTLDKERIDAKLSLIESKLDRLYIAVERNFLANVARKKDDN